MWHEVLGLFVFIAAVLTFALMAALAKGRSFDQHVAEALGLVTGEAGDQ